MGIKYTDFAIRGIDVSTYNGVIDWTDMPAHFASIRVGYGRTLDNKFNVNWAQCKINKFGYWYMDYYNNHISTHPANGMSNEEWGTEQAENCYKFMGGKDIVFLDIESTNGSYAPKIQEVRERVLEIAKAFLIRYDQLNGKTNGIYCSLGLLNWFDNWFKDRPLWVAWYPFREYNTSPVAIVQMVIDKGWYTKPIIWQYASDGDIDDNGVKVGKTYFKTQMAEMDLNGFVGTNEQYEQMFSATVETPDDETGNPIPVELVTTMSVKRLVSLRNAPIVDISTFITLLPVGKQIECIDKKVEGNNIWRKVSFWVAENYNGIQYLK
jgi:GH25 family lysozyme M1 (1,4-beta-N-acetylmuramidase)